MSSTAQHGHPALGFVDVAVAAHSEQLEPGPLATTGRRHVSAIADDVGIDLVPDRPQ